jgi:putative membrane protein
MDMNLHITNFVLSVVYTVLGLAVFAAAFFIFEKITPFSIWKEIEEDQNVALAVMFGAIVIGLALIISAAIS